MQQNKALKIRAREQYLTLLTSPQSLSREECERLFPDLINDIKERLSLVDLLQSQGIKVRPFSLDAPGVMVAINGCPCCGDNLLIKTEKPENASNPANL